MDSDYEDILLTRCPLSSFYLRPLPLVKLSKEKMIFFNCHIDLLTDLNKVNQLIKTVSIS